MLKKYIRAGWLLLLTGQRGRTRAANHAQRLAEQQASYVITSEAWTRAKAEKPDVMPHYGATLDQLVRAAEHNPRPDGASAEYDRIKPHFDTAFYFASYGDIAALRYDPVWHYIRSGMAEGRDPSPFFSTRFYLNQYPDLDLQGSTPFDHWITKGQAEGRVANPVMAADMDRVLGLSHAEIETHHQARYTSLRNRLAHGELGRMVLRAAEWDPVVQRAWPAAFQLRVLPFSSQRITDRICGLHGFQQALDWRRAQIVLLDDSPDAPSPVLASLIQTAIAAVGGDQVVVLRTAAAAPEILALDDPAVRQLHIRDDVTQRVEDNTRLLVDLLRSLRPGVVISDNSLLFNRALRSYGPALRASFRIFLIAPTPHRTELGYPGGLPENTFYRLMPICDVMISHDNSSRDKLIAAHQLPPEDASRVVPHHKLQSAQALLAYMERDR